MQETVGDPRKDRRWGQAGRIALAVLSVAVFVAVTCVAVVGWLAWVGMAMLLAFIEGTVGEK